MKKLFYTSVHHDLSDAYEHEKKVYLIQAESPGQAVNLLRPVLSDLNVAIEFMIEIDFSDSPVFHVEDIYTGD